MNDITMKEEPRPRKIHIETRFGKARRLRSRKDRPCDACRHRKSACIITVRPPCRYCEGKHQDCTFASSPTQRVRRTTSSARAKPSSSHGTLGSSQHGGKVTPGIPGIDLQPDASTLTCCPEQEGTSSASPVADCVKPIVPQGFVDSSTLFHPLTQLPLDDCSRLHNPARITCRQEQNLSSIYGPGCRAELDGGTLDGLKGLTSHFLGPSSDQDANLLSSFRSNILNETSYVDVNIRQVFAGDSAGNLPPVHFNIVHDLFPGRDNRAKEIASERIEEYVASHADALVRLYFSFVHPALPVLSKARFLQSYCHNRLGIPASLRGVVYGLACTFWDRDVGLASLPPLSQAELFEHAHAALLRELDSPKLATLQSCLLIIHQTPPLTGTTESPRTWTFACQATSCAQSLGLHEDPSLWNIPAWEKSLRKKLWWATFVTDKWSSLGHGNPSHIPENSFSTTDLTTDEMLCDEDVTCSPYGRLLSESDRGPNQARAVNFLETVRLAKQLGTLLDYSYTIRSYPLLPATNAASGIIDHSIYIMKSELDSWYSMLPQCLTLDFTTGLADTCTNGALHLAYFAVKSLMLRVMMTPATPLAKSNPFSTLRSNFDSSLEEFQQFIRLISNFKPADLCAFWGRHSRTHLVHAGNFLIYLFLCACTVEQVERSYSLLETYHHALRFLAAMADENSMGMLRPALLRIESFFKEAVEIMRKGVGRRG